MQDSQSPNVEHLTLEVKTLRDTIKELNDQLHRALKENNSLTLRLKNAEDFQQLAMELHPKKDTSLVMILLAATWGLFGLMTIFWLTF